ncbi:hypothetical protein [Algibacter sp. PT7-4]|uniref:hypothetical protein n=1 Tax=Algibacter ulvanivorans TaxID=3400999 RepID=UPI003AABAF25
MKSLKILLLFFSLAIANNAWAQKVYTTKTGEKYHKNNCRYLKYSKKAYTLQKAIQLGFAACSVCKPTETSVKQSVKNQSVSPQSNSYAPKKAVYAKQCIGKTQSGKRCKRKTKNVNQKCYLH